MDCSEELLALKCMGVAQREDLSPSTPPLAIIKIYSNRAVMCPNKHLDSGFSKIQSPLLPKSISQDYTLQLSCCMGVFPQTPLIEDALHGKNASHSQPVMLLKPFMYLINFCYPLLQPCMSHMLCNTLNKR